MQHHFNVDIAQKFGINVAIFLDHMAYWITKNVANNHNFYDGAYWTRNTAEAYTLIFPYWNAKQIRKIIDDCIKYGLINTGVYNRIKYDRTRWYSLTDYSAKLLNITILPKGKMEVSERENGSPEKGTPIPIAYTVTNTNREQPRKKRVSLSDDFKPNAEAENLANEKGLNIANVLFKFRHYVKSQGWKRLNWDEAFLKWIDDEKIIETKNTYKPINENKSTVPWFNNNH